MARVSSEADLAFVALEEREGELEKAAREQIHSGDRRENGCVLGQQDGGGGLGKADAAQGRFEANALGAGGFFLGGVELAAAGLEGQGDGGKEGVLPFSNRSRRA